MENVGFFSPGSPGICKGINQLGGMPEAIWPVTSLGFYHRHKENDKLARIFHVAVASVLGFERESRSGPCLTPPRCPKAGLCSGPEGTAPTWVWGFPAPAQRRGS